MTYNAYRVMVHYITNNNAHIAVQASGLYKWGDEESYNDEIEAREAAYQDGYKLNMRMHEHRDRKQYTPKYIGFHIEPYILN
jgi:hypothetical protein